ncbi:MAG: protein-disulfide reductase DsbD N-terminal domain-containing protein, partial [Psychrobacter sp.]|nr:protein-disulfide reductase DsbD N-terminal domain-containing protein [Psychrobacter sp.]
MNKFIPSVIITLLSSLMVWVSIILTSLSLVMPLSAQAKGLGDLFDTAGSTQSQFLPVNEAFQVAVRSNSNNNKTSVIAEFTITPGHYVYRDKIKLSLPKGVTAGPLTFSQPAHYIEDPQFGRVAVFDQTSVTATTVLSNTSAATVDNAPLSLGWQGCAKAGLCYPPEKVNATVS